MRQWRPQWSFGIALAALLAIPSPEGHASPLGLASPVVLILSASIDWGNPSHLEMLESVAAGRPDAAPRGAWAESTRALSIEAPVWLAGWMAQSDPSLSIGSAARRLGRIAARTGLYPLIQTLLSLPAQLYIDVSPQLRVYPLTDRIMDGNGGLGFCYRF